MKKDSQAKNKKVTAVTSKESVTSLFICSKRGQPLTSKQEIRAILGHGIEGDVHTKHGLDAPNQVLVVEAGSLKEQGLKPGDLREQITVSFPSLHELSAGSMLRVGEVVLQISGHCVPCKHIGQLMGMQDPAAFEKSMQKRRGMLCRVVSTDDEGIIRVNDRVELIYVETETPVISK